MLKPHKCPLCDFTVSENGKLKIHIDSVHNQLKPHFSDLCFENYENGFEAKMISHKKKLLHSVYLQSFIVYRLPP